MKSVNRSLLICFFVPLLAFAAPRRNPPGPITEIRDVSIIDVLGGTATPHQDILIRAGRIAAIRKAAAHSAETRFVIPGLWDMHVNLWPQNPQLALYVVNGVTGVRDMGTDLKRIRAWRAQIARGTMIGPQIYASGPVVSSLPDPPDSRPPVTLVQTADDARRTFNRYYDDRVDFIRVARLSRSAFESLGEASRHGGLPFSGTVSDSISAFSAAQERMSSIEQLSGIALSCSNNEPDLRNQLLAAEAENDSAAIQRVDAEILQSWDRAKAAQLWDLFRRYDVWQTPLLTSWQRNSGDEVSVATAEAARRYVPVSVRKKWKQPESGDSLATRQYEFALRIAGEMARAGVPMLAGSDTGNDWTVPGISLQEELTVLVKAGLTPAQAIRTATYEPARMMRKEATQGQVKKGYVADLVVLSANPLLDIANVRKIETVVIRGRQIGKRGINRILSEAAGAAPRT